MILSEYLPKRKPFFPDSPSLNSRSTLIFPYINDQVKYNENLNQYIKYIENVSIFLDRQGKFLEPRTIDVYLDLRNEVIKS